MIWETRGTSLYATSDGKAYLITMRKHDWILRRQWLGDTGWEVLGVYNTQQEAKDAVT